MSPLDAARAALSALYTARGALGHADNIAIMDRAVEQLSTAIAAAEQPAEPFGYVITNNVPEDNLYRHVFYRPDQISTAYKDNALYSTPVYASPAAPAQAPLTDAQLLAIAREVASGTPIKLTRDVGPYEVTEPTHVYRLLARAIERAHGIGGKP